MKISIKKIAKLANLPISPAEETKLQNQLDQTLKYIENLKEVGISGVDPTSQVTGLENILREDEIKPSLSQEEALSNTQSSQNGFFKIKGIFKDE